jgi:hypothetical protein
MFDENYRLQSSFPTSCYFLFIKSKYFLSTLFLDMLSLRYVILHRETIAPPNAMTAICLVIISTASFSGGPPFKSRSVPILTEAFRGFPSPFS